MTYFVHVYAKGFKIKVLTTEDSLAQRDGLRKEGWKLTNTIDPCRWMAYLYNEAESLEEEVESLAKKP